MSPLTTVKNLNKHRRLDRGAYIGRAGKGEDGYFGNPFKLVTDTPVEREKLLKRYERWFHKRLATDSVFRDRIHALAGKELWCFCAPLACHGHVIAEYLNNRKGFTLLLHGELWLTRDKHTAWQLGARSIDVPLDLEQAVRDPKTFDEAARIIGRAVMAKGVRYAARGARQWERERKATSRSQKKAPSTSSRR